MNVKDPGSRLFRRRVHLEEFDYEIINKRGYKNTNADALSRIGSVITKAKDSTKLDEETKKKILYEFHNAPVVGHQGMKKTFRAIKSRYTWPNMRRDIEEYVKQCKSCQVNRTLKPKWKAPMEITSNPNHPFDKCYQDTAGPLPPSAMGNRYILTFQDDLRKYVVATLISQQDSETVASVFVSQVVLKYGTHSIVQTDQGANFVCEVFKNTSKLLKIKKIQSNAFHPESQGSMERSHRVLANTSEHSAIGYTSFELVFGQPSSLPSALRSEPSAQYNCDDYVSELKGCLQTAHHVAKRT
jgi:hypothetical protein